MRGKVREVPQAVAKGRENSRNESLELSRGEFGTAARLPAKNTEAPSQQVDEQEAITANS